MIAQKKSRFSCCLGLTLWMLIGSICYGVEINQVTFEQRSDYQFPEQMLKFNVQSTKGSEYSEKMVNEDIKRLYSTGYFDDVVAETSKTADGKMNVIFKVTPKARVKGIKFEGNKKFDKVELQEQVSISSEVPLSDKKLQQSAQALRDFYKSKGYNDATITPDVTKAEGGYVDVVFKIDEQLRLRVGDVEFEGNTVYSDWKLRHSIATQHSYVSWVSMLNVGLLDRNVLDRDKLRLREMYWNKGYLDFKILDTKIVPEEGSPEYVDITFQLEEGETYKVGNVTITGNERFSTEDLMKVILAQSGQTYDNRVEKGDVSAIENKYFSLGYADFRCRVQRLPDFETHTVDLEYKIEEGQAYKVKDVRITGNKVTKDRVIRRELAIQPGDPVDPELVDASRSRIMGMGYFKKVDAVTVDAGELDKKNVDFRVEEKQTAHFKVGGGYSDTDSLVGMVELSQTNFDLFDPENYFQGGGQRLRAQGFFGLDRYDFNVDFSEPWLFDIPLRLDLGAYLNEVEYDKWSERRYGGKGSLTKPIFDDFTNITLGYKFERVKVFDLDDDIPWQIHDEKGRSWVSTASLGIGRDTRDSMTEPTEGYELNALYEITPKALGASENYMRIESKASYYWNFFDKALILHVGGKVGFMDTFGSSSNDRVPLYERYFLGGGNSLRGFPYRSVSPVDDIYEDPLGGESMYLVTAEVTHPIYDFIRGAIFVDAGNSVNGTGFHDLDRINIGAGYGLRIKVPHLNAPIKLDLAYPVRNEVKGLKSKMRFHFNMGFSW